MGRKSLADFGYKGHKVLGVAVGHVEADEGDLGDVVQDLGEILIVSIRGSGRAGREGKRLRIGLGKILPLIQAVILVDTSVAAVLKKQLSN